MFLKEEANIMKNTKTRNSVSLTKLASVLAKKVAHAIKDYRIRIANVLK